MNKKLLITAAILGILGIVLGAFAAHSLEMFLDVKAIKSFETGVRYQMYHALFILILGGTSFISQKTKSYVLILVITGVIFFSFSIYGLATNALTSFDFKTIAFITPIGGLLMIISLVMLGIKYATNKSE